MTKPDINFYDLKPKSVDMKEEVLAGLASSPKTISPKYFYDQRGSELFDNITQLKEYYPTRTETEILRNNCQEIADLVGSESILIEFGSGSSEKIRIILESIKPSIYMPLDISKEHLVDASKRLAQDYQWLEISAICVDYSEDWKIPLTLPNKRRVAFFPGSSIGNFDPNNALLFLKRAHKTVQPGGGLLIGVDRKKDEKILKNAYDDSSGITEKFNKNILHHINEKLDGTLEPASFQHSALYNTEKGRVEMHLVSKDDQQATIAGETISLKAEETIHTESSYKYSVEEFTALAGQANFDPVKVWSDEKSLFSVYFFAAK